MKRFIDTHCHGLYGVDDGVQDIDGMLRFLLIASKHNTGLLFMTPHYMNGGKFQASQQLLQTRIIEMRSMIAMHRLPIDVRLGSEIFLDEAGLVLIKEGKHLPYQNTRYVLIESVPPYDFTLIDHAIDELKVHNQIAIIAHPERYFLDGQLCMKTVENWLQRGAFCSVNRTSFWNVRKPWVMFNAFSLLNAGYIHIIASDAHHAPGLREPRMDDIFDYLCRWTSHKTARELCIHNPQRLADNQQIQYVCLPKNKLQKKRGLNAQFLDIQSFQNNSKV